MLIETRAILSDNGEVKSNCELGNVSFSKNKDHQYFPFVIVLVKFLREINNTTYELNLTNVVVFKVHTDEPQLLSPGVYRGDYFIHEIELLLVYYQYGMIFVRKLAGDGNIPGDKISIRYQH
ncbi:hypothetical protein LOD99_8068 [Oopsacas minuta]|uniref:Uncharacterized protein n=1 Tax=Oopsacas minuta TaxID=111878 RepID=A0AAV7JID6_9METZ|nr:hypothetical protein LOD99_8068 [Oopsacas minuta]